MICKWADDSQSLIMGYFDAIQNSPSEIYSLALPFCPHSSWLHEYYSELPGVEVVKGFQSEWGECSRTVSFDNIPKTLTHWKDIIAVGFWSGQIIILDAVTGIHMFVLSGHTQSVDALTFSLDGTSLVSGDGFGHTKLWDIQTGGFIRTFHTSSGPVLSVSISMDNTVVASVYWDGTIWLWDTNPEGNWTQTKYSLAMSVSFSLTDPQLLMIISTSGAVVEWRIDGCECIFEGGLGHECSKAAFSSDRTCFVLEEDKIATVCSTDSGEVIAELSVPHPGQFARVVWSISPDGKFVACGADNTIHVWDITGSDPHLVKTLIGHTKIITSISFSSLLISSSVDKSIRFWQTGISSTKPVATGGYPTSSTSSPFRAISLQAKDNVAILVDKAGLVRTWDLSTGLCKASFSTPAISFHGMDVQLIGDRVTLVWHAIKQIHVWDTKGKKHHQLTNVIHLSSTPIFRISGDGSKVFVVGSIYLQAFSTQTGEVICRVRLKAKLCPHTLIVDGSRVWACSHGSQTQGWDFGVLGSTAVPLSDSPPNPDRPRLDFINFARTLQSSRIVDTVTEKEVFRLPEKFAKPAIAKWDGRYLVAGYDSGEVLILDFDHMIPQ